VDTNLKQIHLTLPYLETEVAWNNNDRTYIIGTNGSGKTLLLNEMKAWCDTKQYNYVSYYAAYALEEAAYYIENASDDAVRFAADKLYSFSFDFKDDIVGWAKALDKEETDPELLREVFKMCGAGYSRVFVMLVKAFDNPDADYYFMDLPETSLHLHLAGVIVDFLMNHFEYMKFVVTTHSPEVVQNVWNQDGSRDKTDVIEMNFDHINKENDRKFSEQFA